MKKVLIIFASLLLSVGGYSQGKLVKSSEKSTPIWVKKDLKEKGAVKFESQSTTSLEEAKKGAVAELTSYIVNSTLRYMMQFSVGDSDQAALKQEIENSQYVKNVGEATALANYWEVRFIKSSSTNLYKYYILYHFDDIEMKKIALDINKKNSSIMDEF